MLHEGGQITVEILCVMIVVSALLVLVLMTVQQRNNETELISTANRNMIQCNAISETIADLYNNRAVSEQVLLIDTNALIKKEGSAGAVSVGDNSCRYIGVVEGELAGDGIELAALQQYRFRKDDSKVVVCEMPC